MPQTRKPPSLTPGLSPGPLIDWPGAAIWLRDWRNELVVAFVLLWVAYGFLGFNLSTAGDDWVALTDDSILIRYALENGRWIHAWLMVVQDHSRVAPTFSIAVLLMAIVASMAMFANALQLRRRGTVVLFVLLAGCFPFWAEFASFRILHLPGAFALVCSCAYGFVIWRIVQSFRATGWLKRASYVGLAGLLFSLCAATYQGFLPIGAMLLGCYLMGALSDGRTEHRALCLSACGLAFAVLVVGVLLYAGQVSVSRTLTGIGPSPEPAYQLASSLVGSGDDLRQTVTRLGSYLWAFYAEPNHLFPLWPKFLFGGVALVFVVRILFGSEFSSPGKRAWMVGIIGFLVLAPWALGLIRLPDPYRYNAIVSAGLIYAVVICYTLDRLNGKWVRVLVTGVGALIALCFLFQQNAASNLTHQTNLRDMAVVNRLLDRLTAAKGYPGLSRHVPVNVVLSGEFQIARDRPFRSGAVNSVLRSSIVDCDVLRCQPARLDWVTPLASADAVRYRFVRFTDQSPAYQAVLQPVIAQLQSWPASGSLQVVDDATVVVRLPEAGAESMNQPPGDIDTETLLLPVTSTGDGFVRTRDGVGAFSVALSNVGAAVTYRLTVTSTLDSPDIRTEVCETDTKSGACLSSPVSADSGLELGLAAKQNRTYAIFVHASEPIPHDVLANRLVVRLVDAAGNTRAATSVAVASVES